MASMRRTPCLHGPRCSVVFLAALAFGTTAFAQVTATGFKGRPLADALRSLQAQGLRIVFTSSIVTPDLRVETEPRSTIPRLQLDELLAPHRLEARDGPGGIVQIVRAKNRGNQTSVRRSTVTGTIRGRVLHGDTGASLPGVAVEIDGAERDVRTDEDGRFVLPLVSEGTRVVRAAMTGFAPAESAVHVTRGRTVTALLILEPASGTHREFLTVSALRPDRYDRGVPSEASLDRRDWEQLHPGIVDDPSRALHMLPRVSALDDFRSEFTVRGSGIRHIGVVVDGVSSRWLQHAAHGRGVTASLTMLTGQALEQATLRAGAYPRRHSDQLGAELELTIREGSRADARIRGSIGGPNATFVGEGPLGRTARGSWLMAARQSFLEWPTERAAGSRAVFGFSDVLAKLVYDVTPGQQVVVSALGGRSQIDGEDASAPGDAQPGDGRNNASVVNFAWRSSLGFVGRLTQRAYVTHHAFDNTDQSGSALNGGSEMELVYRADLTRPVAGGLLETGAQVARSTSRYSGNLGDAPTEGVTPSVGERTESSWRRAAYVHVIFAPRPALTISPGLRVTGSPRLARAMVSPWILGEWTLRRGWTLNASVGVSHQIPDLQYNGAGVGPEPWRQPERAVLFDVAIEQRLTRFLRWQATFFSRSETDVRELAAISPRLGATAIGHMVRDVRALRGSARGFELLIDRTRTAGLSGWVAYSYGTARYTDRDRQETFWADLDRRHAVNAFATYRLSDSTTAGATFRAGTSFPVPGYLAWHDSRLYVANRRNTVRLPLYARLDLRADHRFEYLGRRLTVFAELQNVLNRRNLGLANGVIQPTGEAVGFTGSLFPRRVTAGLLIEF